jgi:hypothetical protein
MYTALKLQLGRLPKPKPKTDVLTKVDTETDVGLNKTEKHRKPTNKKLKPKSVSALVALLQYGSLNLQDLIRSLNSSRSPNFLLKNSLRKFQL